MTLIYCLSVPSDIPLTYKIFVVTAGVPQSHLTSFLIGARDLDPLSRTGVREIPLSTWTGCQFPIRRSGSSRPLELKEAVHRALFQVQ